MEEENEGYTKEQLYAMIVDSQKETSKENRKYKKITIVLLIVSLLQLACIFYLYFGNCTTVTETTTTDNSTIELYTDGENANAEYINGDQYNDSSAHYEGGDE